MSYYFVVQGQRAWVFVSSAWIPATVTNATANEVTFTSEYGQVR